MQIHLSSDKYDIIHSGQVFLFEKNKNLRLEVDTEDDLIFTIELRFYENESGDQEIRQNINENQISDVQKLRRFPAVHKNKRLQNR